MTNTSTTGPTRLWRVKMNLGFRDIWSPAGFTDGNESSAVIWVPEVVRYQYATNVREARGRALRTIRREYVEPLVHDDFTNTEPVEDRGQTNLPINVLTNRMQYANN